MEDEPLSLGSFDPSHALHPYLNTPRSLEACRRHGVNPIELVEIPFDEFRKNFPNDLDAAQRRYERIDGARRAIFNKVLKEWDEICSSGWVSTIEGKPDDREAIIDVAPDAHSSMLELQAAKFRKIEKSQWTAMQRMIGLEIKAAVRDMENKKLVAKHKEIEAANDDAKKAMAAHRDELFRKQIERKKQQEIERAIELKQLQEKETQEAIAAQERKKQKLLEEKKIRERRENDRKRREQHTKEVKDGILKDLNMRVEAQVADQLRRDKERKVKLKEYNQMMSYEKSRKNKVKQDRMAVAHKILNDQRTIQVEEARTKIEKEEEERLKKIKEEEEEKKKREAGKNFAIQDKLSKIRAQKDKVEQDKIQGTAAQLKLKEAVFKKEMEKLKAQQDRRKQIKMIRQEAFELSNRRRKKADDYKHARLLAEIKRKDDIYQAQKQGSETLGHMRHLMHEIMQKTKLELKTEIHNLNHKDTLNPDNVVQKVLEVSSSVMFPHLSSKFVIDAGPQKFDDGSKSGFTMSSNGESKSNNNNRASTAPQQGGKAKSSLGLTEADISANTKKRPKSRAHSREPSTPLPLRLLEPANVATDIAATKTRVLEGPSQTELIERQKEIQRQQIANSNNRKSLQIKSTQRKMETQFLEVEAKQLAHYGKSPVAHLPPASPAKGNQIEEGRLDFTQSGSLAAEPTEIRLTRPISKAGSSKSHMSGSDVLPVFDDDDAMSGSGRGQIFTRQDNSPMKPGTIAIGDMGPSMTAVFEETGLPIPRDANGKGPDGRRVKEKPGEFRREYSHDHPLAGGQGKYKKERGLGKRPVGGAALNAIRTQQEEPIEKLTINISRSDMRMPAPASSGKDLRSALEKLRKDQNEILLRVLEEERKAEEDRARAARSVPDVDEKNRLELVFAEERRRASERIIQLTKEHEANLKAIVLGPSRK